MINNSTTQDKKRRFDETFKILLTIFTVLISIAIGFYKETSPEMTVMLFSLYSFSVGIWCIANLLAGESEYLLKFLSWYALLGGIIQSAMMLYTGTLDLDNYYYAADWGIAIFIYYLIFRYVKLFMKESAFLKYALIISIPLGIVLSTLKFLGIS